MKTIWYYVALFFVSMVPLIELRGTVPMGIAWIEQGIPLNLIAIYIICIIQG